MDPVDMRLRTHTLAITFTVIAAGAAAAQSPPAPAGRQRKFEITDNSFLVEESFNQERGVFQNIFTWTRSRDGDWQASFTQEWPAPGMTHQLSYTIPFSRVGPAAGFNDVMLNYRYQVTTEAPGRPAIAPRLSLILPTGRESKGLGDGAIGLQLNVPVSKQFGDLYLHGNGGGTWINNVDWTPHVAGSGIWRVSPMFNLMLESVLEIGKSTTVSPGFRRAWNVGDRQIVIGAAVPFTRADGKGSAALLTYFSYELPFR
jgi:hypothetical protein